MKIFRDPFVQFLLAGTVLYTLFTFTASEDPAELDRQIRVDAATLDWIHSNFAKQFRRPPTQEEMDALVRTHIEHEVKYREALSIGLDERDTIVQRRLVQKFDFLFGDSAAETEPDDASLQAWYGENGQAYETPATITFSHHWFNPDTRKDEAGADAHAAVKALNAGETTQGDRFPFNNNFTGVRPAEVRRIFGQRFVDTLFDVPLNTWVGPLESGLGYHAVRATERAEGAVPPLDEVRDAVLDEWRRAESLRILEKTVGQLIDDYSVTIDEDALDSLEYARDPQGRTQ